MKTDIWKKLERAAKRKTGTIYVTADEFREYWESLQATQRVLRTDHPLPNLMYDGRVVAPKVTAEKAAKELLRRRKALDRIASRMTGKQIDALESLLVT